jgi:hypothetical protein
VTLLTGFDLCRAAMSVVGISAPEQSVLNVLAVMANDEARCWPGINGPTGLTGKTKLSERSVQRAVQALKDAGHINWQDLPGRGRIYLVHPRQSDTPATVTPRHTVTPVREAPTPATVAPKLPRTTIPPKVAGKHDAAGTLVPLDFTPIVKPDSITGKAMAAWPPGLEAEQVEHFIDRHTTQGTKSLDWQASWRTWVKNWKSFNGKRTHDRRPAYRGNDLTPMARALVEREASRSGAWDRPPTDPAARADRC